MLTRGFAINLCSSKQLACAIRCEKEPLARHCMGNAALAYNRNKVAQQQFNASDNLSRFRTDDFSRRKFIFALKTVDLLRRVRLKLRSRPPGGTHYGLC